MVIKEIGIMAPPSLRDLADEVWKHPELSTLNMGDLHHYGMNP